jgi:arsenate reductase (thioredoxin)
MSQALFERIARSHHEARSAGTEPADRIHPSVVAVMREDGIDLSMRVPQRLTNELAQWADVVITMGCGDACPVIPGKKYVDWDLRDPKDLPIDEVRALRADIESRVTALVKDLDHAPIRS